MRYERSRPGSLVHTDIQKLARTERVGHRIHGDRSRRAGADWEFYHATIDDASRLACGGVLESERKETWWPFRRASCSSSAKGATISELLTDIGSAYRSNLFRRTLEALGIPHIFTRPYTPKTNGKVERFIRTSAEEWAYGRAYAPASADASAAALARLLQATRRPAGIGRR